MARELGGRVMAEAVRGESPLADYLAGEVVVVTRKHGLLVRADRPRHAARRHLRRERAPDLGSPVHFVGSDAKIKA